MSIGTTYIIVFFCVLLFLSRLLTSWCKSIRLCLMAVARSDKMLSFFVQYFTYSELSCLDFRERKKFWSCPCGRLQKPLRLGSKRPHALWDKIPMCWPALTFWWNFTYICASLKEANSWLASQFQEHGSQLCVNCDDLRKWHTFWMDAFTLWCGSCSLCIKCIYRENSLH